jgi:flagellar motor switch protein FliN/FliY
VNTATQRKEPATAPDSDGADALDEAIAELHGVVSHSKDLDARDKSPKAPAAAGRDFNPVIMDIPIELQVVIGSVRMSLQQLMALENGAVVALDTRIGAPVQLWANGSLIGHGELQVMDKDPSRIGLRVLSMASAPAEKQAAQR